MQEVNIEFYAICVLCRYCEPAAYHGWLGGLVVRALDSWSRDFEFDSWPWHCRVATQSKWFTPMCLCRRMWSSGGVSDL